MQIDDLPKLKIDEIIYNSDHSIIIGFVNRWEWVGEKHAAYLYVNKEKVIEGEFQDVNEIEKSVKFITTDLILDIVKANETYPFFEGYWGQRAALVFDNSLQWEKTNFKPRDAIKHKDDGSKELIKDGWDHEHCDICWVTIDLHKNTVYMKSNLYFLVCLECFENYILKKSIDFITDVT